MGRVRFEDVHAAYLLWDLWAFSRKLLNQASWNRFWCDLEVKDLGVKERQLDKASSKLIIIIYSHCASIITRARIYVALVHEHGSRVECECMHVHVVAKFQLLKSRSQHEFLDCMHCAKVCRKRNYSVPAAFFGVPSICPAVSGATTPTPTEQSCLLTQQHEEGDM